MEHRDQHISTAQILASGYPDANVRAAARELTTALFNGLISAG